MKPPVARWLEFAEIDLKAAGALLKEGWLIEAPQPNQSNQFNLRV